MEVILGREEEIDILNKLMKSEESEFLAVYGRRRVGKTYLIDRYFREKGIYFHFTGMKDATLKEHLELFREALLRRFSKNTPSPIKSWLKAFAYLKEAINQIDKSQKIIIFFDELPWIATRKSGFLKVLEHFWNDYLSRMPNAILVVCGSAASWMIKKIVHNKGGLHNRLTATIRLEPFSLRQTELYLKGRGICLSRKQIIDLYMLTGGVAKYLSYIEKGESSSQVIQNLCFQKNSPLAKEYQELYSSLFENYQNHIDIVEALAKKRVGMTHTELLKATKKSSGGRFTATLEELKEAGFIGVIPALSKKKKEGRYYLSDEYSLFYLNWMEQVVESHFRLIPRDYWLSQQGSAKFASWAGFAFENLCRKHVIEIIKALKIEVVATGVVYSSGAEYQVDLIIDRRDHSMNLCEIKFYNGELIFDQEEAKRILFRRERFRENTKTRKTLFNTLISTYGAKENGSYLEAFDNQVTLDVLFG